MTSGEPLAAAPSHEELPIPLFRAVGGAAALLTPNLVNGCLASLLVNQRIVKIFPMPR